MLKSEFLNFRYIKSVELNYQEKSDYYRIKEVIKYKSWWKKLFSKIYNRLGVDYEVEEIVVDRYNRKQTKERFLKVFGDEYYIGLGTKNIISKANVKIVMADGYSRVKHFDSSEEAEKYFKQIVSYCKENNVPILLNEKRL